jgi:hypothetical protein
MLCHALVNVFPKNNLGHAGYIVCIYTCMMQCAYMPAKAVILAYIWYITHTHIHDTRTYNLYMYVYLHKFGAYTTYTHTHIHDTRTYDLYICSHRHPYIQYTYILYTHTHAS